MGRFPTCSSPVRHGYSRKSPVRLACIRHAASVNPEPGSNSPPKMLASASELAEGLCFTLCVRRPRCASSPKHPTRMPLDQTRRSSIFGRPLGIPCLIAPPPIGNPCVSQLLPGNQPVKVRRFDHRPKHNPHNEGRLIYHVPLPVSRKDQDRLRALTAAAGAPPSSEGRSIYHAPNVESSSFERGVEERFRLRISYETGAVDARRDEVKI
jgi:hypothetical protein